MTNLLPQAEALRLEFTNRIQRFEGDDIVSLLKSEADDLIKILNAYIALAGKAESVRDEALGYEQEKHCCTICDAKKVCHVCGVQTLYACSDCRINFNATVYVCTKSTCRDAHERKCYSFGPEGRGTIAEAIKSPPPSPHEGEPI